MSVLRIWLAAVRSLCQTCGQTSTKHSSGLLVFTLEFTEDLDQLTMKQFLAVCTLWMPCCAINRGNVMP